MPLILEAARAEARLSPRVATALGTWVLTAVVSAHSGARDADLTLEELAGCL